MSPFGGSEPEEAWNLGRKKRLFATSDPLLAMPLYPILGGSYPMKELSTLDVNE
jgi:hypothetical protein